MTWTQFQDPKNPVTLHKLFGSIESEARILDLFNSLGIGDCDYQKLHFQKVLSITPTPPPSNDLSEGLEDDLATQEALLSGHITYRLEDHRYRPHIVQLFVPQIAQCESKAFFYAARTFMQQHLENPEDVHPVNAFIFTPFRLYRDFHKQPVLQFLADTHGEGRWADTVELTYIQLPALTTHQSLYLFR